MAQTNTAARQRLFRMNPHCFWCGKLTVLSCDVKLKHDAATVDHLYSRLHPERKAARRGRGRSVLACNQCNRDRSNAETRGLMFAPKLGHRRAIAELTTITPLGAPAYKSSGQSSYRVVLNPFNGLNDFGWTDSNGDLRPRSWEEYCSRQRAFTGPAFEDRVQPEHELKRQPKRQAICTIGEYIKAVA